MNYFSSDFKLGILGGGQIGKMLLAETRKFDIQTYVLDSSDEAPARLACNKFFQGDLLDFETVYQFGKKVDLLTLEIENVNLDALDKLEVEGIKIYPSPKTLRLIQNKTIQKEFYINKRIPCANGKSFDNLKSLLIAYLEGKLPLPFVWKSAQYGYDGNGVKIIKNATDIETLPDIECLVEELISIKNEIAVIVARNLSGEMKLYPIIDMEFHPDANQVEYIICPSRIYSEVAEKVIRIAIELSELFNHVGILAIEMFQTEDDEILINEVAPRPHNSGHFTIEASFTSQFENHIRAILNLPLGNTANKISSVMVNLVGEEGFLGPVIYKDIEKIMSIDGVYPHIYGKKETRPFRKMGHVTIVNENLGEAIRIAEKVKSTVKVISNKQKK